MAMPLRRTELPQTERLAWIWTVAIAVVALSGLGFIYKLVAFAREALGTEAATFALVPIIVYLLVAAGFVALFLWALTRGQFRDVEAPKRRVLEMEEEYDRQGI